MKNTIIKKFDAELARVINSALEEGIEISTVILALDKYLFNARTIEAQVLEQEEIESRMTKFVENTEAIIA